MSVNVGHMPNKTPKLGRPPGLLINPDAARYVLAGRSQTWLAEAWGRSTAFVSEVFAGSKGVTPEVAQQLAEAMGCPIGVLFPETVEFRTQVRHFVAPSVVTL